MIHNIKLCRFTASDLLVTTAGSDRGRLSHPRVRGRLEPAGKNRLDEERPARIRTACGQQVCVEYQLFQELTF